MPLAAIGQVAREPETPPPAPTPTYKYEAVVGYSYTSLNQVNLSRYGLQGVQFGVARDWGKHFGILAMGDEYKWATSTGNPGNPSVTSVLAGPQFRFTLFGPIDVYFRGLLGGEHTGGESETPSVSFAGGFGGGAEYRLSPHLSLRAVGDRVGAAFSVAGNTPGLAYSPHTTLNSRGTFAVVYRF